MRVHGVGVRGAWVISNADFLGSGANDTRDKLRSRGTGHINCPQTPYPGMPASRVSSPQHVGAPQGSAGVPPHGGAKPQRRRQGLLCVVQCLDVQPADAMRSVRLVRPTAADAQSATLTAPSTATADATTAGTTQPFWTAAPPALGSGSVRRVVSHDKRRVVAVEMRQFLALQGL